jgi:MFS family permease
MTKIDKRKNIIISFKSNYKDEHKPIDKQIRHLRVMSLLNVSLSIICGGMILLSIISEQFGIEILKWEKSAIISILSISFFLNFPNDIYEYKLLRHFKKIIDFPDFPELEKLNIELKNIIDKLNKRRNLSIVLIILIIAILVMGLWQVFDGDNQYWIYMKLPILVLFGFIIFRFIQGYNRIIENIEEVESTVANNG